MPGSIRLLVLEAFDLPETIPDGKEVAIKVAVGAREFQTALNKTFGQKTTPWSSDFVFPVLNLRDNLVVMLLDKNGEIISKGEIDTPSIVEKGSFEIDLLLNGGGNIHLSLSFVLTDEERRRIDTMRAAALKRREQEASKSTANPQIVQKESDSMLSDPFLSPTVGEPEKDVETYEVSKGFSLAASQEPDESQSDKSDGNLQDTHQEPLTVLEPVVELDSRGQDSSEERSGIGSISSQDSVKTSQTATDQMNPDFSATIEIPSQACLNSELEEQAASESSGESPKDLAETSNSVKAKVKAFETTRPKGAIKQGMRPPTAELQSPSPRFKSSPRRKVGSEAEQEALPKENLDLIDTSRTEDEELDSGNQMGGVQLVSESNLAGDSGAHKYKQEKDCLPEREVKEVQSTLEPVAKVDCVEINERDMQKEKTLLTASKQKRRLIDLHGVSKQVLNGAIVGAVSGAVLVAAGALLWARNPNKRRNTSARHQILKQRTRK